jgi:membrane protease YdiL (CAAX protease family)
MIESFYKWLTTEPKNKADCMKVGLKLTALGLLWIIIASIGIDALGYSLPDSTGKKIIGMIRTIPLPILLILLVSTVVTEEAAFRLPLALILNKKSSLLNILVAASSSGLLFGVMHGSVLNIFIQGSVGFLWALLFIKTGGTRGRYVEGFFWVVFMHFLYDSFLLAFVVVGLSLAS